MKEEQECTTKLNNLLNQEAEVDLINQQAWENRFLNPLKSLEISKEAFEISTGLNYEYGIAVSLLNSGSSYFLLSVYDAGIIDLTKAVKLFLTNNDKKSLSYCYYYIGNIHTAIENFDEAIAYYEKAGSISVEIDYQSGITNNLAKIGYVHFLCKRHEESHFYLSNAKNILTNNKDEIELADVLINIGKNYFVLNQFNNSLKCFTKALSLSKKNKYYNGISLSLLNLGTYFDNSKDYDISEAYFIEALEISEKFENNLLSKKISLKLSELYEKTSNFHKAFEYLKKSNFYKKEIQNLKDQHGLDSLKIQFDLIELEKEKCLYDKKNKELIKFQKELKEKNVKLELLSLVASQSDNVIIIMDALGKINFVSDSFIRFNFGLLEDIKAEEGKTIFDISNNPDIRNIVDTCIAQKKSISYESLNISITGEEVWGSALLTPVFDDLGELTNLIIVENDITERKNNAEILHAKNLDITSSITYAKRIQEAILPNQEIISNHFLESFILNQPKDIVSGDFYWFDRIGNHVLFALADCTGHGVPGAFMSMIGAGKLNDAVAQSADTSVILSLLNKGVKSALKQSETDESATRDGMDIALCSVDTNTRIVKYAGANRPIWIIRNGQTAVEEIKATKKAIGGFTEDSQHFDSHEIKFEKGDTFYISTDGFADTFGGLEEKKVTTKRFKEILVSIQDKTMKEQEQHLDNFIETWKGGTEQIDDILVIGVRL